MIAQSFSDDGFVVLRGVVDADTIAALRQSALAFVDQARLAGGLYPAAGGQGPVYQVVGPHRHVPSLLSALCSARIIDAVTSCLTTYDPGLQSRSDRIRAQLLQDALVVKPALVGGAIGWHQDHTYTGYIKPAHVASIRIALGREDAEHGGLEALRGSHRWGIARWDGFGTTSLHDDELEVARRQLGPETIQASRAAIDLDPGDVSIHHCLTFHRSVANRADVPRLTLVAHVLDADCVVDESALTADQLARYDRLPSGNLHPLSFPILNRTLR